MRNSLERINPLMAAELEQETINLHLERYRYAGEHLAPGMIADIACGVGYGSHLLATNYSEKIKGIVAVDNDRESIAFARSHYHHPKIRHVQADALQFQNAELFQTLISLETIEHLEDPDRFVRHLARQLAPGGRFIASVPVTPSMDANPFHRHDFTEKTFVQLFQKADFQLVHRFVQTQPFSPRIALVKSERRADLRGNILGYYFHHPHKLLLRLRSLAKDGFCNKYLVCVFEKR